MALLRCVTEMGMGVDVHGLDYTSAAKRSVFDAIHHSSLGLSMLLRKRLLKLNSTARRCQSKRSR